MWGGAVPVAAPRGDEGGIVPVVRMERYTVVSIPCVKDGFFLSLRDRSSLMKRRLGVVCFLGGMGVEGLKVNCPSWCTILFGADDHSMTPCNWFSNWHWLNYSQSHVSV